VNAETSSGGDGEPVPEEGEEEEEEEMLEDVAVVVVRGGDDLGDRCALGDADAGLEEGAAEAVEREGDAIAVRAVDEAGV
jgi:hypothetical protein